MNNSTHIKKLLDDGLLWRAQGEEIIKDKEQAISQCIQTVFDPQSSKTLPYPPKAEDRKVIHSPGASFGCSAIDDALPAHGLPTGAIHEWSFVGGPRARNSQLYPPCSILALLAGRARNNISGEKADDKFILWIGRHSWPTPYLLQKAIHPISRCLFIDPPSEKLRLWAVETALRSPSVSAVIAEFSSVRFSLSRRLALAAQEGGTLGLFIRPKKALSIASASTSRWEVTPAISSSLQPRFQLTLLKYKGQEPQVKEWNVELEYGDDNETISMRVPTDLAVRQDTERTTPAREKLPYAALG